MKKILYYFLVLLLLILGFVVFTNIRVKSYAKDKLYSDVQKIPKNKVGLLLGTSKYLKGGGLNPFFKNRVEAAVTLFNHHKIDYILVSGDNRHVSYNEPRELQRALLNRGIPQECIVFDFAGFRTLDSVVRAHLVFGLDSITLISQKFHNERALYIAEKYNMSTIGFNAEDPENWSQKVYWREYLAKTKSYLDILLNVQPKFLGDPIPVGE